MQLWDGTITRQAPYCCCPQGVHYDTIGQSRVSCCRPAGSDPYDPAPHDRIAVDVVTYHRQSCCPQGVHYDTIGQSRVSCCRPAGSDPYDPAPHDRIAVDVVTYHRQSLGLWF